VVDTLLNIGRSEAAPVLEALTAFLRTVEDAKYSHLKEQYRDEAHLLVSHVLAVYEQDVAQINAPGYSGAPIQVTPVANIVKALMSAVGIAGSGAPSSGGSDVLRTVLGSQLGQQVLSKTGISLTPGNKIDPLTTGLNLLNKILTQPQQSPSQDQNAYESSANPYSYNESWYPTPVVVEEGVDESDLSTVLGADDYYQEAEYEATDSNDYLGYEYPAEEYSTAEVTYMPVDDGSDWWYSAGDDYYTFDSCR